MLSFIRYLNQTKPNYFIISRFRLHFWAEIAAGFTDHYTLTQTLKLHKN